VADPKLTLSRLATLLVERMSADDERAARSRTAELAAAKIAVREKELALDAAVRNSSPLHFSQFAEELGRQLPPDAVIFDEALTNSPALTRYCVPTTPGHFFQTRGGSLGVGIPGAIGAKLAMPGKTVIGVTGDGGAMYTIQALWSAARHNVDAKFIICNNRSYRLLQLNISAYWQEQSVAAHPFPLSFDLSKPQIDFVQMANSMGVAGARIERPEEIAPAIRQMLDHQGPFLLDVIIEGDIHPELVNLLALALSHGRAAASDRELNANHPLTSNSVT
jgi:benzoylformate decarboxylase